VIVSMLCSGAYGGISARRAAGVGRVFAHAARTHEDGVPPTHAAVPVTPPRADEPDDYMCCECGRWWPCFEPLSEAFTDPWGHALKMSTVRTARDWLANAAAPEDAEWGWHPVYQETYRDMTDVVDLWPGDVCGECWAEWDGEGVSFCADWPTPVAVGEA